MRLAQSSGHGLVYSHFSNTLLFTNIKKGRASIITDGDDTIVLLHYRLETMSIWNAGTGTGPYANTFIRDINI